MENSKQYTDEEIITMLEEQTSLEDNDFTKAVLDLIKRLQKTNAMLRGRVNEYIYALEKYVVACNNLRAKIKKMEGGKKR